MKTFAPKLYEAMFLVDSAKAAADWDGIIGTITSLLGKCDAEILSLKKWDERRLAYDISRQSRGTYILCYFNGDGQKIGDLERNVQLSEEILRVLILRGDHVKPEDVEKDTPSTRVEKAQQAAEDAAKARDEAKEAAVSEEAAEAKAKPDEAAVSEEAAEAKAEPDEAVVAEEAAEAKVEADETVVSAESEESEKPDDAVVSAGAEESVEAKEAVVSTDAEESVEPEEIASSGEETASVEKSEEPPAQVDTEGLAESAEEAESDEVPDMFSIGPEVNESEETEKPSE